MPDHHLLQCDSGVESCEHSNRTTRRGEAGEVKMIARNGSTSSPKADRWWQERAGIGKAGWSRSCVEPHRRDRPKQMNQLPAKRGKMFEYKT